MRLSHLLLAAAMLLPFSTQAITLDKLGGVWKNTDVTCKEDAKTEVFCGFVIKPKNKSVGIFQLVYKGKLYGQPAIIAVSDADVWTVSVGGEAITDFEYEDGFLYDDNDDKYHRVSK